MVTIEATELGISLIVIVIWFVGFILGRIVERSNIKWERENKE